MTKEKFTFRGSDQLDLYATRYVSGSARGTILVIHGMAEHRKRYEEFGERLCENNFNTYIYDQRGHGDTAVKNSQKPGHLADKGGWNKLVEDLYRLRQLIRERNGNLPVFLFGHSMGSFVARDYITKYGEGIGGAVLSGTSMLKGNLLKLLTPLAKLERLFRGKLAESKVLEKIMFSSNNRDIDSADTAFDWLTRDKQIVEEYVNNDRSGFSCTTGFYDDFVYGLKRVSNPNNYPAIPRNLPILFISGSEDPVGGRIIEDLAKKYRNAGLTNVGYKLYPDARHELINELNREEVYNDLTDWLEHVLEGLNE